MPTYGDKTEPSILTDVGSTFNGATATDSPITLGVVGQAALGATGSDGADPNTVYRVTGYNQVTDLFGPVGESLLTNALIDQLNEGAFPIYAVAAGRSSVSSEDISGIGSTSGTLAEAPVTEDASEVTFTVDSTDFSTTKVYTDPSQESPDAEEAVYNPVTGDFELGTAPSSSGSVDYDHFNYDSAIDAMVSDQGDEIDMLAPCNENAAVSQSVVDAVDSMAAEDNPAVAIVGPGDTTIDPSSYDPGYDSSRVQVVFGTRFEDDTSLLAAYAGQRANLGIDRSPISITLESDKRVADYQAVDLKKADRGNLIDARVVPIADRSGGAVVKHDVNTVTDSNTEEANIDLGITRLIMDTVLETAWENERPFIGRFNRPGVRNAFRDLIHEELTALEESGLVLAFNISVEAISPTEAKLTLNVDAAEPILYIHNDMSIGNSA
jgi:hypothetical protein